MANEDKATRYHRLQRRAALAATLVGAAFLAGVLLSGASVALRDLAVSAVGPSRLLVTTVFAVTLVLLQELVELPLSYYRGVTLERRYGLSTETGRHWWMDHVKGALVGGLLALLASVIVSALLVWSPDRWWMAAAVVFAVLLIGIVYAAPVILFPLFYEFKPLDRPPLTARLLALAGRCGTTVGGVFEWRLGDRTRKANAALVGAGHTRRILLSDTLLAAHSDDEIEVILAHELAHHVYRDVWSGLALQSALALASVYAADTALDALAVPLGLAGKTDVAALPLVALAAGAVSVTLAPLANAISRAHERRADRFAIELTSNAGALVTALRRLAAQNLAEEQPSRWVEALFHSHPSTHRRIEAARRWTAPEVQGGLPPSM